MLSIGTALPATCCCSCYFVFVVAVCITGCVAVFCVPSATYFVVVVIVVVVVVGVIVGTDCVVVIVVGVVVVWRFTCAHEPEFTCLRLLSLDSLIAVTEDESHFTCRHLAQSNPFTLYK